MRTFRKIAACVSLAMLAPGVAAAAECGVGNKIWAGNDGTGAKVLAFTTNFWTMKAISTTFEILGCTEKDNWLRKGAEKASDATSDARLRHFANENLDHLAVDMARGHGEHLDVLVRLIDVRDEDRAAFRSLTREKFEALFPHDHTTTGEMLDALRHLMAESDALSNYVEG